MSNSAKLMTFTAMAALLASMAFSTPATAAAADQNSGSITIIFKDGHQHTYSMSDIARIEFNTPAQTVAASVAGRGRFLGRWRVGDGAGGTFTITLNRDGSAHKTEGGSDGTWTVVNGEARISWDDGWTDVLRLHGNRYEKVAYAPGKTLDSDPSNVTNAEMIDRKPI
jgi:hypothetical protein